jgi:hypothetical protein
MTSSIAQRINHHATRSHDLRTTPVPCGSLQFATSLAILSIHEYFISDILFIPPPPAGRNTEYVDTLDGLKAKDSVDPYREVILIPALARNEYPTEMIEGFRKRHANGEKMCQMVQRVTKEMFDADKDKVRVH